LELLEHISTREISLIENILRSINLIFIIFIEIFIILHYQLKIDLLKIDKRLSEFDNIFTSGLLKNMLIEMFVCGIFYPPVLNQVTTGTMLGQIYAYNYNALVSIFALIKMYLALRAYSYYSRWTTDIAKSICNKYNVKMGLHLTIKSELKKRPLVAITIMMIFSLGICSYCMRTFEYNVYQENSDSSIYNLKGTGSSEDLSTIANCMWLIIVTMTTVGYGDFYPKSHLGRFVGVISCIIGMLLVSLIVVSLTSILDFSSEEKKAYSVIKKLHAEDNVYCKATEVIKSVLLIRKAIRKRKEMGRAYLTERFILFTQLKRKINNFKNDYRYANSYALPIDEMLKKLEIYLKEDIKRVDNCINKMRGINDEIEEINNEQEIFDERIKRVIKMQEDVSSYLINLNNERFKKNLMKFKEKKSLSKSPFLSPNINYEEFSDDNDIKHVMKKNSFNQ
jgi:hypothetical protein